MRAHLQMVVTGVTISLILGTESPSAQASGRIRDFPIPTPHSNPGGIVTGPDGNLWFTEALGNKLGVIRPSSGAPPGLGT